LTGRFAAIHHEDTKTTKKHEGHEAPAPTPHIILLFFVSFVVFVSSW